MLEVTEMCTETSSGDWKLAVGIENAASPMQVTLILATVQADSLSKLPDASSVPELLKARAATCITDHGSVQLGISSWFNMG